MRNNPIISLALAALLCPGFCHRASAQSDRIYYDPLLDPSAVVIPKEEVSTWGSTWMWHPGQLAAYLQAKNLSHSKQRCVNVGYPGNYYSPSNHTTFKNELKLSSAKKVSFKSSGTATVTVDGRVQAASSQGTFDLAKGRHSICIEVVTDGRTPAVILDGIPTEGWMASVSEGFVPVETDALYNSPDVYPDDEMELTVEIPVKKFLPLRSVSIDRDVISMQGQGLVVVDFTLLELAALSVEASGEGELSFYFGESLEEAVALRQSDHEQALLPGYSLSQDQQTIVTPVRGYRYAAIRSTGGCTVRNVKMLAKVWPVEMQMQFDCEDKDLVRLFDAGVGTQHASVHNFYLDGVKRDFLPWAMDAVASSIGGDYAFGLPQISRNGISIALLPPGATKEDMGVVDYPLHALIGLKQEYLRYNDTRTALMYRDRIEGQMALYESLQDERGFISSNDRKWGFIPGWDRDNGPENIGTPAYAQMLLYHNFRILSEFETLWGDKAAAQHYTRKADALRESILEHFWDEDQKAFVNGFLSDGTLDKRLSHHSQSWAVYTDLFPKEHIDNLYSKVYPSMDYYLNDVSYEKGYEAISYIKSGKTKEFVDVLKSVWLRWLDAGNTRYPENFMINQSLAKQLEFYGRAFGLSLCHGANGVPPIVTALYGVLGFNQKDVDQYTITPDLLGMKYASGRIPVSQGYIEVDFRSEGQSRISVPSGCTVTVSFEGKSRTYNKAGSYTF